MQLEDGAGTGNRLRIDSNNRAHVDSVGRNEGEQAALVGDAFNVNTGGITLTSANKSAVFFLEYNGNDPLVIEEIIFIAGATTGGSGDARVDVVKNPTAGTIVSGATAVDINQNRNFSSSLQIDGNVYKGAEGNTVTDGSLFADTTRSSSSFTVNFDAEIVVLQKGNSIAVEYTPAPGNTSQEIKVAVTCFVLASEVVDGVN